MKNISPKGFVNTMYWFFRIIFWLHLLGVSLLLVLNYIDYNSKDGLNFTLRGNIYAYNTSSKTNRDIIAFDSVDTKTSTPNISTSKYGVVTQDTIGSKVIYFLNGQRIGFMRIDYKDFSKAFTIKNIGWTLADISLLILWLLITYQIMMILQSLKKETVFIQKNIKRIKFIGWSFILIPFIEIARDQLFFLIARQHLKIPEFALFSNFQWNDLSTLALYRSTSLGSMGHSYFPNIALGLIILIIVQIFKNGFELQKENDLTI